MDWLCKQILKENGYEDIYTTQYNEKVLNIRVLYETENQARLKAVIIVPDKERQTDVYEYLYRRVFVGMGKTFHKKMGNIISNKLLELQIIATEEDSKILSRK